MPAQLDVKFEPWLEAPLLQEPVQCRPVEQEPSHGSTIEDSHDPSSSSAAGDVRCGQCDAEHPAKQVRPEAKKTGRPVVDRAPSQEELLQTFKHKLRLNFHKIDEKFSKERSRTDKYRTMFIRMLKRVVGEVAALIGIDSYAKSPKIDRYLPEFDQMRSLISSVLSGSGSQLSTVLDDDRQCQVYLSFSFYSLYVSKERCQEMAASVGISESVANSLLSREQTALKDFKAYSATSPFFRALVAFSLEAMRDELHKFETLAPFMEKMVKDFA